MKQITFFKRDGRLTSSIGPPLCQTKHQGIDRRQRKSISILPATSSILPSDSDSNPVNNLIRSMSELKNKISEMITEDQELSQNNSFKNEPHALSILLSKCLAQYLKTDETVRHQENTVQYLENKESLVKPLRTEDILVNLKQKRDYTDKTDDQKDKDDPKSIIEKLEQEGFTLLALKEEILFS